MRCDHLPRPLRLVAQARWAQRIPLRSSYDRPPQHQARKSVISMRAAHASGRAIASSFTLEKLAGLFEASSSRL
jgi:hypothetical protein